MITKKEIREAMIIMSGEVHADRMISKRDGTFEVRRGFFYTHGMTSAKLAAKIAAEISGIEIASHREGLHPWPKDSFWAVRVKVVDAEALVEQAVAVCNRYACEQADLVEEIKEGWE